MSSLSKRPTEHVMQVVWDLPTRIFKWSLVIAVTGAFLSSSMHPRGLTFIVHVACGYTVTLLVLFRLIWGFIGGRYARFRSFLYGWRDVKNHTLALLRLDPPRTTGHNPVGGWVIIVMLATLAVIVITGLLSEGRTDGRGRLSSLLSHSSIILVGYIHSWLGFLIVWIAGLHVAGVLVESVLQWENLVRSMITGRKEVTAHNHADGGRVPAWRAAALLVLLLAVGAWLALGTRMPPG